MCHVLYWVLGIERCYGLADKGSGRIRNVYSIDWIKVITGCCGITLKMELVRKGFLGEETFSRHLKEKW
jgi:hypothetical protein